MTEATKTLSHPQHRATHPSGRMQRRHFELIAEIIAKELDGEYREKAAYAFAYILPTTNGNFDSQRFLKACKVSAFTQGGSQWMST
jgi:hypothetical protein